MASQIELEDSDVRIIEHFCDVALKSGGLTYYNAVARILSLLPRPEPLINDEKVVK